MRKNIFTEISGKKTLFTNRSVLTAHYLPDELPGREEEINTLAQHLYKAFDMCARNAFIYGLTGCGKTAVTKYVFTQLREYKPINNNVSVNLCFINCKQISSKSQIIQTLINSLNNENHFSVQGLSIPDIMNKFIELYNKKDRIFIVAFDEIDKLPKISHDVLYDLTRLKEQQQINTPISTLGISNDIHFFESLDQRIQSSFGHETFVFKPYNAPQLTKILTVRAEMGVKEGVIDESVIPLCSALGAQEHGDARKALDLLRISIEIAENDEKDKVTIETVKKADKKMESQIVENLIETFSEHKKILLLSLFKVLQHNIKKKKSTRAYTGEIYSLYGLLCNKIKIETLTQRRVADYISQMDMLGIINTRVISRGRYGRSKEISLGVPLSEIDQILREDEWLSPLFQEKPVMKLDDFT